MKEDEKGSLLVGLAILGIGIYSIYYFIQVFFI